MNLSYYTVDDLRLGHDPKGVVGWRMSPFLSLDDALTHYASLPATGVKSLGLTDGVHCLEIARCVPLFEYDREGEDILASDYKQLGRCGGGQYCNTGMYFHLAASVCPPS